MKIQTNKIRKSKLRYTVTNLPLPLLRGVSVELTNHCNMQCKMCLARNRPQGFMPVQTFKHITDKLSTYPFPLKMTLSFGGESTIHPKFEECLEYALKSKLRKVGLVTNGTHLEKLLPSQKFEILISIHKNYWNICEDLEIFVKNCNNLYGEIRFNLCTQDVSPEIIKHVRQHITPIAPVLMYSYVVPPNLSTNIPPQRYNYCVWVFRQMSILWNSDVTTCCETQGFNKIGNLNGENPIKFWYNKKYNQARIESIFHEKPKLPLCQTCNLWKWKA